jgi:hypothetical protein
VKIKLTNSGCTLYREDGDKRLTTENSVTHAIKTLLIAAGIPAARMREDVGLTSCTQTLRLKTLKATLWHERYQIEDAAARFNTDGEVFYQRANDQDLTEYESEVIDYPLRAFIADEVQA